MSQRQSQNPNLTLGEGTPNAVNTQNANFTLSEGVANALVTEIANIVLAEGSPGARVSTLHSLILADITSSPYYIQGAGGGTSSLGGSHTVTMLQNIVVGSRLVIITCLLNTARSVGTVQDNAAGGSSAYTFVGGINIGTEARLEMWVCDSAKTATQLTITLAAGTSVQCSTVTEWKGSVAFGNHIFGTASGATDPSISLTIQENGNTVVGGFVSSSAASLSPGNAFLQTVFTQPDTGNGAAESAQSFIFGFGQDMLLTVDLTSPAQDFAMAAIELRSQLPIPAVSVSGIGGGGIELPSRIQIRNYSEFIA